MYVGKNLAVRDVAKRLERIFKPDKSGEKERAVEFQEGPLGLEIEWTAPPVVVALVEGGMAEALGVQVGLAVVRINEQDMSVRASVKLRWL